MSYDLKLVLSDSFLTDLCEICVQKNLVFPALEAFEQRLDNPTLYWTFYDSFLKSLIGDDEWKHRTGLHPIVKKTKRRRKSQTHDVSHEGPVRKDKRMTTPLDEAFVMVMLKNNYFAWLWKAKDGMFSGMVTDYDVALLRTARHKNALSLGESKTNGTLVCLRHEQPTDSPDEDPQPYTGPLHDDYVIWKRDDSTPRDVYESARIEAYNIELNDYKRRIKTLRDAAQGSEKYKAMTEGIQKSKESSCSPQAKKQLIQSLKPFTGGNPNSEDTTCASTRGAWSEEAYVELATLKDKINQEKELYKQFNMAYRRIYEAHRGDELKKDMGRLAVLTKPTLLKDDLYNSLLHDNDDSNF